MSTINIDNGVMINQLDPIYELDKNSVLPLYQGGLTKQASLMSLRQHINGDASMTDKTTLYYSADFIDKKISLIYDELGTTGIAIQTINDRLDNIETSFGGQVSTVINKLDALKAYVDAQDNNIKAMTGEPDDASDKTGSLYARTSYAIDVLNTISKISYGTTVPTALGVGEVYFQYF